MVFLSVTGVPCAALLDGRVATLLISAVFTRCLDSQVAISVHVSGNSPRVLCRGLAVDEKVQVVIGLGAEWGISTSFAINGLGPSYIGSGKRPGVGIHVGAGTGITLAHKI